MLELSNTVTHLAIPLQQCWKGRRQHKVSQSMITTGGETVPELYLINGGWLRQDVPIHTATDVDGRQEPVEEDKGVIATPVLLALY